MNEPRKLTYISLSGRLKILVKDLILYLAIFFLFILVFGFLIALINGNIFDLRAWKAVFKISFALWGAPFIISPFISFFYPYQKEGTSIGAAYGVWFGGAVLAGFLEILHLPMEISLKIALGYLLAIFLLNLYETKMNQ